MMKPSNRENRRHGYRGTCEGSSYRRPGARMLITEDGQLTGAFSGGCLEGDALRKALLVMNEKNQSWFDTMDEKALFDGKNVQSLRKIKEVIHRRSATMIGDVKLTSK